MKKIRMHKKDLLLIVLLVVALFVLNNLIFGIQLNYGFRDVDWEMLYYYKIFGNLSLGHLVSAYKLMGAYTYELYYVGILEKIVGLNFTNLHQASQLFKIITGLGIYFVVWTVLKRRLLAVLTSLIYTISYTHAGALFMLSTGGYFFATIFMCLFFIAYYYSLQSKKILVWTVTSFLLVLTLILNTERMYPLIPFLLLVEFLLVLRSKFKRVTLILSLKRTLTILLPLVIFSFIYVINSKTNVSNVGFSPNQFFIGTSMRINAILNGNWQLLLYPFASFGSIFFTGDYWKLLGIVDTSSLYTYTTSLIFGPVLKLGILSFALFYFISKKPIKLSIIVSASLFLFGMVIYAIFLNWVQLNSQISIHFDPNLAIVPAIFGFYVLCLSLVSFFEWKKTRRIDLLPLIIGPVFTMIFILLTWLASDLQLLFLGPQRYLSIPSMGTSLFISGLILVIFNGLKQIKLIHSMAWGVFLFLILLIPINYSVAYGFFNDELVSAGMGGVDQTRMKDAFHALTPNIDKKDPSLFYFDETADKDNGYFDESTILAGFEFWTQFNSQGQLDIIPKPAKLRTNTHQCPEVSHESCLGLLKKALVVQDGTPGFLFQDAASGSEKPVFYKLSNFYAFRFLNKNLVDIKTEVVAELKK